MRYFNKINTKNKMKRYFRGFRMLKVERKI